MNNEILTEKYRPKSLTKMSMDKYNKIIINAILSKNIFPNLLFYGPPGTGKTTTIVNLIENYLYENDLKNKGLVMHYNASDDRGIDVIRNNIQIFIKSNGVLSNNIKFVILDEVDYMTKQAQIQLKQVIEKYYHKVRFCLICNYICKIEKSLLSEFITIRFSNISKPNVIKILTTIVNKEKLDVSKKKIIDLYNYYDTDIRSMINYLQHNKKEVFSKEIYNEFVDKVKTCDSIITLRTEINKLSLKLHISNENLIKMVLTYHINCSNKLSMDFIMFSERNYIYEFDLDYSLHYLRENNKNLFD